MTEARIRRPPRIFSAILLLIAVGFLYGGSKLVAVGGSWYYLVTGLALTGSAMLLWRRHRAGAQLYGIVLAFTFLWALYEAGADLWALMLRDVPIEAAVARVNEPPAPPQQRVLCRVTAPWQLDQLPFEQPEYQPIPSV